MVNKNNNHDACCELRDAGLGSEESPILAGCSARGAGAGAQDGEVQSPMSKVQSRGAGEVEFEGLRSKTAFSLNAEMVEGGISLATDSHGLAQIGTGTAKKDFLTADKAGLARMEGGNGNIEHPTSNAEQRMEDGEARTRTKNRNDEGRASGALCLFVPPNRCGCLGSPGKTPTAAVGGQDLAGAVQDALAQNWRFPGSNSAKLA